MKVVIAPDSFKESLSAERAAHALADGVRQALPDATIVCVPMGDGGEGTLDAVLAATGGQRCRSLAHDALGRPREVDWGYLPGQTAFIEMAEAAGLERIALDERDVGRASTSGVGEVIRAALDAGATRLVIGLGGSATNDGGAGMLQALGCRLLDSTGKDVLPGGKALAGVASIDTSSLDARLSEVQIEAATDVDNPLCGPAGASAVFGPQKGATADDVRELDRALAHFADLTVQARGRDVRDAPGTGAAGGLGFALQAYLGAVFRPGVAIVAELNGLAETLRDADLVYTGEGRMDAQTIRGKTPFGVAQLAQAARVPVIAVAGSLGEGYEAMYACGLTAAFSLVAGPATLAAACADAPRLLAERARDATRLWAAGAADRTRLPATAPTESTLALPLDHLVINTRFELPAAAGLFEALGFTLTPQGRHTLGSINHLMVFERDYLELIGLPTDGGLVRQEVLDSDVGIDGLVYQPESAERIHAALTAAGTPVTPVQTFSRPVELDGTRQDATFRTVRHPADTFEAGRVYYCQHLTPELVWRAPWQVHANGVHALTALVLVSARPEQDAHAYAQAAFGRVQATHEGWTVAGANFRVDIVAPSVYAARYGDLASDSGGRDSFFGAIVLSTRRPDSLLRHVDALGDRVRARAYDSAGVMQNSDSRLAGLAVALPGINALLDFAFVPER